MDCFTIDGTKAEAVFRIPLLLHPSLGVNGEAVLFSGNIAFGPGTCSVASYGVGWLGVLTGGFMSCVEALECGYGPTERAWCAHVEVRGCISVASSLGPVGVWPRSSSVLCCSLPSLLC